MAENIPSGPSGAVPPKKETGKVQPKKETVRINLPPKPSAAPTIKLPTLPPGGPTPGGLPPSATAAPAAAPAAPRATAAPAAAAAPRPAASAAPRAAATQTVIAYRPSTLDTILAIAAAIIGLAAIGTTIWMWQLATLPGQ